MAVRRWNTSAKVRRNPTINRIAGSHIVDSLSSIREPERRRRLQTERLSLDKIRTRPIEPRQGPHPTADRTAHRLRLESRPDSANHQFMAGKHHPSEGNGGHSPSGHGHFKYTVKPASLKQVLAEYGLKRSDYLRIRELVQKDLHRQPAHAR